MISVEHQEGVVRATDRGNRYYRGPQSDHFDGTVFFNPGVEQQRRWREILRWQFGSGRAACPRRFESPFPQARPDTRIEGDGLRVTMVGHATLLIQTAGLNILTDPVWSERASPFAFAGPKRLNPPGVALCGLPPIDLVLLSHNHYDHMDIGTLKCLRAAHDPLVVTPLGNDAILHAADPQMHVTTLDWGQSVSLRGAVRLHATPCHHWSARGVNDRRMALWSAFAIETPAGNIYHVADTGFVDGRHYRAAREKFGGFRLAVLPIGAYEPRWFMRDSHQSPEEAVRGMKLAGAAYAAGHHWGTFRLTDEAITAPVEDLAEALKKEAIEPERFRPLHPGESWDVPLMAVAGPDTGNRS